MSGPVAINPSTALKSLQSPIAPKLSAIDISTEDPSAPLPFYSSELHNALNKPEIFFNNRLVPTVELPQTTEAHAVKLIELIDTPFPLTDHHGVVVLKKETVRQSLIDLHHCPMFKASGIKLELHLAGGGAKVVCESSPEWQNTIVESLIGREAFNKVRKYIQKFPPRELPDIDIHVICKSNSGNARASIIDQFLQALSLQVMKENNAYILKEMGKVLKTERKKLLKDRDLSAVFDKIQIYYGAVNESRNQELLHVLYTGIATEIVKRNCLKKFSNNPLGTFIAFGKLELVLIENPKYLFTPDRLKVKFELDVNPHSLLSFQPLNKATESILHQTAKIACIDSITTEHTLPKGCIYLVQGYSIPNIELMYESVPKFVKAIYSELTNKLDEDGIAFINRYCSNHFNINPEEGLCSLLLLFKILTDEGYREIIPLIVAELKPFFENIVVLQPILKVIQYNLLHHPLHVDYLYYVLRVLPFTQVTQEPNRSLIIFKREGVLCPYLIPLAGKHESALQFIENKKKPELFQQLVFQFLKASLDEYSATSSSYLIDKLFEWVDYPGYQIPVFYLLLRQSVSNKHNRVLSYTYKVYQSVDSSEKSHLLNLIRCKYGESLNPGFPLLESKSDFEWILFLAKLPQYTETAFLLWEKSYTTKPTETLALTLAFLPLSIKYVERILYKKLYDNFKAEAVVLRDELSKTPLDYSEYPYLATWIIGANLSAERIDEAKVIFAHPSYAPFKMQYLPFIPENYWILLDEDSYIDFFKVLAKAGRVSKCYEGLQHLLKLELSQKTCREIFLTILELFPFLEKCSDIERASLFTRYLEVYIRINAPAETPIISKSLLEFLKTFRTYHKRSKGVVYASTLRALSIQLTKISIDQWSNAGIDSVELSNELLLLIKDSHQPYKEATDALSVIILPLFRLLLSEKREKILADLLRAIDHCSLKIPETDEIKAIKESLKETSEKKEFNLQELWAFKHRRLKWLKENFLNAVLTGDYGTLSTTQIRESCNEYFSNLRHMDRSHFFPLMQAYEKLVDQFDGTDYSIICFVEWDLKIHQYINNPNNLTLEENKTVEMFNSFVSECVQLIEDDAVYEKFVWSYLNYAGSSTHPHYILYAWESIKNVTKDPCLLPDKKEDTENLLRKLLKNSSVLSRYVLEKPPLYNIIESSGNYYKNYSPKSIPPEYWMKHLHEINHPYIEIEALMWMVRYIAESQNNKKSITKENRIIIIEILTRLQTFPLKYDIKILKAVGSVLNYFGNDEDFKVHWRSFLQALMCHFERTPEVEHVDLLTEYWMLIRTKKIYRIYIVATPDFVKNMLVVFNCKDYKRYAVLWNEIFCELFSSYKVPMDRYYYDGEEFPVLMLPVFKNQSREVARSFVTHLNVVLLCTLGALKRMELKDNFRFYFYDIIYNSLLKLVIIYAQYPSEETKKVLLSSFKQFIHIVKMSETRAFEKHVTACLPDLIPLIQGLDTNIFNEEIFYEAFALTGCKNPSTLINPTKAIAATYKILSERFDETTKFLPPTVVDGMLGYMYKYHEYCIFEFDDFFESILLKLLPTFNWLIVCKRPFNEISRRLALFFKFILLPSRISPEGKMQRENFLSFCFECFSSQESLPHQLLQKAFIKKCSENQLTFQKHRPLDV